MRARGGTRPPAIEPANDSCLESSCDADLIEALKCRHSAAWSQVYEAYNDRLYRFAYSKLGSDAEAEDLTASVFDRAIHRIESYNDRGKPLIAWLFGIAKNLVKESRRTKGLPHAVSAESLDARVMEPPAASDWGSPEAVDLRLDLNAAMTKLTRKQRQIITLRYAQELSADETGRLTGRSPRAVRYLEARALMALRSQLNERPRRLSRHLLVPLVAALIVGLTIGIGPRRVLEAVDDAVRALPLLQSMGTMGNNNASAADLNQNREHDLSLEPERALETKPQRQVSSLDESATAVGANDAQSAGPDVVGHPEAVPLHATEGSASESRDPVVSQNPGRHQPSSLVMTRPAPDVAALETNQIDEPAADGGQSGGGSAGLAPEEDDGPGEGPDGSGPPGQQAQHGGGGGHGPNGDGPPGQNKKNQSEEEDQENAPPGQAKKQDDADDQASGSSPPHGNGPGGNGPPGQLKKGSASEKGKP